MDMYYFKESINLRINDKKINEQKYMLKTLTQRHLVACFRYVLKCVAIVITIDFRTSRNIYNLYK